MKLICDISVTHKYGKQALDLLLAPHGVCWQEMVVLMVLEEAPEAPQSLLGALLQTDKGNVTKLLTRMEAKGLLVRQPSKEDRRRMRNALSEPGASLVPALRQALAAWEAVCYAGLSQEEQRIFNKASQTIIHNTSRMVNDAQQEEAS